MRLEGEKTFNAPRDTVWRVLNSPEAMAKTMPGVESFDIQDEKHWTANVKIPLGLGGLKMKVDMEKVEEREPEFAKMAIKGQGVGAMMNMETSFTLSDADAGGHRLGVEQRQRRHVGRLGGTDVYGSSVDVVGPSGSASYDSGASGFSPSSAPLEPSGSAGPSAGGPASS